MRYGCSQVNTPCTAAYGSGWFSAAMAFIAVLIAGIVFSMSVVFLSVSVIAVRLCIIMAVQSIVLVLIVPGKTDIRKR